ncbi:MAG: DUF3592 domain-containing protein [Kiritimatiellae bacterium]|nr:DUF3592 domain-containing protein [Kiritimatiellia bacterium]
MVLFWIIFLLFGCFGVVAGISHTVRGVASRSWPKTRGRIVSSEIESYYSEKRSSTIYSPRVPYVYMVEATEHRGGRVSAEDCGSGDIMSARKLVAKYRPGSDVEVYHDPHDPDRALLEPGFKFASVLMAIVGMVFLLAAILGLLGIIG